MEIIIRRGESKDADTITEFMLAMALETEGLVLPFEKLNPGIMAAIEDEIKGEYYIAEIDGDIAGSLMITREWSDWRNCWVAWIQSVYTRPEFRGKGVYKSLYDHVKQIVRERGYGGIRLYVEKTNTNAQNVYEKLGMDGNHYRFYEWMIEY